MNRSAAASKATRDASENSWHSFDEYNKSMTHGRDIVKQWENDAKEDHKKNIIVFVSIFVGWIVASAIACQITYPLWDKGVIGLLGFLLFCWVAFWFVMKIVVRLKRSKFKMIRDIKRFDERRKEILRQRAISSLNKAI